MFSWMTCFLCGRRHLWWFSVLCRVYRHFPTSGFIHWGTCITTRWHSSMCQPSPGVFHSCTAFLEWSPLPRVPGQWSDMWGAGHCPVGAPWPALCEYHQVAVGSRRSLYSTRREIGPVSPSSRVVARMKWWAWKWPADIRPVYMWNVVQAF